MKIRKSIAGVAVALLAVLGVGITAQSASAHTPEAWATCDAVYVKATNYETKPATQEQTEQKLVSEAVPYQPAVYGEKPVITPAVEYQPAVYETEYEFAHKKDPYKTKWSSNPNWNAENNENSLGWYATGNTRPGKLVKAEVLAQDAVYGEAPLISAEVPAKDAVYETVVTVPGGPADAYPNNVTITVDGVEVVNMPFGKNFETSWGGFDKYAAHEWSVTITAWNDPQGYKGWTKTISGTTTPCEQPPLGSPNHNANGEATCGAYSITLYNQQGENESVATASFVTYIDGTFANAYAVEGGQQQTITGTFPEDSGNHQIIVRTGPAQGDEFVFSLDVTSDCITPQPEDKVTFTEWVDGEFECDATEVPQTRTKTVTPYVLSEGEWVEGTPVVTTETDSRPLTAEEQEAADIECAGEQPENKVVYGEWKTGEYECGDTTVQITRQVTSTEYVRDGAEWVEGESVTTTQTETRDLTDAEIEALDCAVVVPPTEQPKPTPSTTPAPPVTGGLAATGGDPVVTLWALTGGALMVALGALAVLFEARRRQVAKQKAPIEG